MLALFPHSSCICVILRWKGTTQVSPDSDNYELVGHNSLRMRRVRLRDLGPYSCQVKRRRRRSWNSHERKSWYFDDVIPGIQQR